MAKFVDEVEEDDVNVNVNFECYIAILAIFPFQSSDADDLQWGGRVPDAGKTPNQERP